jgi:hypothetical protein
MAGIATPELFEPPAGRSEEVDAETLHRAFSALFTLLLERAK